MIGYSDPSFGGAMYGCDSCGTLKFVPFRCHSRFFPTCGTKYSIDRTTSMSFKIINIQHRHCVFTIDSELRHFFLEDRSLLRCDPKVVAKYIGRYLGRPVIATSLIDKYDGENVTFHYNRHEDNKLIVETIPVMEFISRLIRHIPEKHFKQIRYYGLYARHKETDKKLVLAIAKEKRKALLSFNRWRDCTLASFGYDPLKCPHCGKTMLFLELYHNHQHISLNEMYERTMKKFSSTSTA